MPASRKLAILIDPNEEHPPSNKKTLDYLINLSQEMKIKTKLLTKADLHLLKDHSALFIRTITNINNYTFHWAVLAEYLHLNIIDTSQGISLGSNKHLQFELCKHKHIRMPETQIVYFFDDISRIEKQLILKFPLVLKIPDGAMSNGAYRIENLDDLKNKLKQLFARHKYYSIILQQYLYTEYDWRIGILNNKPLFVCKYYMVEDHWQIIKYHGNKIIDEGIFETISIKKIPKKVLECAQNVASMLDKGLYGIDIKLHNNKAYFIEINDNPDINFDIEDMVEKDVIYNKILTQLR